LLTGQFNDPIRIAAFDTLEHWAADVSAEIAAVQIRCDIQGEPVPHHLSDFVQSNSGPNPQLTLRLACGRHRLRHRQGADGLGGVL
jgi:hypothetical protein